MRAAALAAGAAVALGWAAPAAHAGDPIMPLWQVQRGMQCEARSVLHGTAISTFGAEVVDIVAGDAGAGRERILFRFSGGEIDRTGVGPGFSGSPIYCRGGDGVPRVAAAISEGVGEYGNSLALATPIEQVLAQPVEPAVGSASGSPSSDDLRTPLTIAGLSPRVGAIFSRAAARHGRSLLASAATPRAAAYPPQTLVPGSAFSAGLSSGDLVAGAVGTVTYVDDGRVWGFGHPLDGAGRRSLFLQDAYVYAVVNNPVGGEASQTYKLAAPGNDLGVISGDGANAVAGRLGAMPDRFPMKVVARDVDTGRVRRINLQLSDETAIGQPTGSSALSFVGTGAVAEGAASILNGGTPGRQTGDMCVLFHLRERPKPMQFCNRYVARGATLDGGDSLGVGSSMTTDFAIAVGEIDAYNFGVLHLTGVEVYMNVRRGLKQAFLVNVRAPKNVRRGRTARLRVTYQEVRGPVQTRTVRVKIPEGIPSGRRHLTLAGTPSDEAGVLELDLGSLLFDDGFGDGSSEAGPRTVAKLATQIARLGRYDGVRVSFQPPGGGNGGADGAEGRARKQRRAFKDPVLRLSGRVRTLVNVK
jgi:hypothetical protein